MGTVCTVPQRPDVTLFTALKPVSNSVMITPSAEL